MSIDSMIDDDNDDEDPELKEDFNDDNDEEEGLEEESKWIKDGSVTAEGEQKIHDMAEQGIKQTDIADEIGVSQGAISSRLRRPRYHSTNPCLNALDEEIRKEVNKMSSQQTQPGVNDVEEIPTGHGEVEDNNSNPLVHAIQNLGANKDGSMSAKALRAINEARDKPQFYMNNRQAFYQMLRGAGFEANNAEAITQAADANYQEQGPGFTYGGDQSNNRDAFDKDPMDKMMDEMMDMMRFQQMRMMMESMSGGMGGGGNNTDFGDMDPRELMMWKALGDGNLNGNGESNQQGDIKMARVPGPDGEFKQVPVQSSESLMPMMMMSMMGGGDSSSMGPEDVVTLVETLKNGDSNDDMMRELLNEIRERDKEMMNQKFERIEEQVAGEEKSGLDFLDTIQEYEGVLGPMFGQGQNWEGKKDMMELQLENMDKFVDQRLRMIEKLNEMEKQTEMADAFSSITEEGVGGLAQGLGQIFGNSLLNMDERDVNGKGDMMGGMMGGMKDMNMGGNPTPSDPSPTKDPTPSQPAAAQKDTLDVSPTQDRPQQNTGGGSTEDLKKLSPQVIDKLAEQGEIDHLENLRQRIEQHKETQGAS